MTNPTLDLKVARSPITRFSLPAWLVLVCVVTFTVLIGAGAAIYKNAPPIPATMVSPQQETVLSQENIQLGQETYLARGGQHIGSIWGHGSYLAPDWTADVLHRWGLATAGVLYRIPLKFFLATCFWNLVGAGVFGFLINPPIVLYYSQGINTTPIHAHSALFGVYGSLALALMLFALREITPDRAWNETWFNRSFWSINIGLGMMMVFGLIPSGFYQLVQSVNHGTWYARSAEVISSAWMHWTVWLRIPGDVVFSLGALLMVICVLRAIVAIFQEPTQLQPAEALTPELSQG
ncbi:MAG: cbb3-type cytochrome c oxidase subunit I [Phormidium sp.]|nr:MAG: nitric oxide reductase subunit NorB [Phormidium sp. OSCR]